MKPLVITRPEPGATSTAEAAGKLGLDPVKIPLFEVAPIEWITSDPGAVDALLFTSANAVRLGGADLDRLRSLPAHCVGEATADAARAAGFDVASIGASGVDALLESLPPGLRLLHLSGTDRRAPRSRAEAVETIAVYEARPLPMPAQLGEIEGSVVALYSPRASERFFTLATEAKLDRGTIAIAAISADAAAAAGDGWERVEAAPEPTDSALLSLAARLCNNRE
jgi:uroporphyrinogen-III synthase